MRRTPRIGTNSHSGRGEGTIDGRSQSRGRGRPKREVDLVQLVEVVTRMLEESGPEAVSVEATATALGISRGTLYRTFPSRDDLVWMVLDRMSVELDGAARAILRNLNLTPRERLEHLLRMQLEVAVLRPRSLFVLFCGGELPTETTERLQIWRETYERRWLRAIRAAIRSDELPAKDPHLVAWLIAGITISAASRRSPPQGQALQSLVDAAVELILRSP